MKKIICSVLFLTVFLTSKSQEKVFPLFEDNPLWNIFGTKHADVQNFQTWFHYYTGDTIICDTNYSIARIPKDIAYSITKVYIKVDGKKVLYRNHASCDSSLHLLYDFDLSVGDTVKFNQYDYGNNNTYYNGYVSVIDSLIYQGDTIKRLQVKYFYTNSGAFVTTINWLEGVGSDFSPFYLQTFINTGDFTGGFELVCLELENEVKYMHPDVNDCVVTSGIEEKNEKIKTEIYPNPVQYSLYISNDLKAVTFQVFDLFGRQKMSGIVINNVMDVSELATGIYVLHLTIQDKDQEVFRFVKE